MQTTTPYQTTASKVTSYNLSSLRLELESIKTLKTEYETYLIATDNQQRISTRMKSYIKYFLDTLLKITAQSIQEGNRCEMLQKSGEDARASIDPKK